MTTLVMRLAMCLAAVILVSGCVRERSGSNAGERGPKTFFGGGQKGYTIYGKLVSRDAAKKEVTIESGEVLRPPMTVAFEYRSEMATLPGDGTKIKATLHELNGNDWISDVKETR